MVAPARQCFLPSAAFHARRRCIGPRLCIAGPLLLLVAAFSVRSAGASARIVRVGLYQNEPKIFLAADGRPSGFLVEILNQIASQEGWTLEYAPCVWSDCLAELEAGQIDLMPDVAYSAERALKFDFHHTPAAESWSQIYAGSGVSVVEFADLSGKRVAVLRDSIQQTVFTQYMQGFGFPVTIVPTDSLEEAFRLTEAGEADAAIANHFFGDYFYRQYRLTKTPIVFNPSSLFYATAKGRNGDLLAAIDTHLDEWLQESNSPYYTTLNHWLAKPPVYRVPTTVYWGLGIFLGLLLLSAGAILLLRRQVAVRTGHLEQVNRSLAESERKYRELVELANSIILHWSRDGKVLFLNEFGQRFFGYSAAEIVGRPVIGTIVPSRESDGRDLTDLMNRICADPQSFEMNINENIRRNGERVWIAWTNRLVRDESGRPAEILSIGTDITDRKRADEEIRELNATLEQRVADRTAELAVARDRAEAADRLKSAFLATMSHELRTPLNSIIGFTGIILQGLAGPLTAEQSKQLGMVRDSARHLLALINDVLDISKIEAGQLEMNPEPFDLRASLQKTADLVRPLAEKKGLILEIRLAPEVGTVVSDPRRVEQIVLNLLNNAVKYTEHGGVKLSADVVPFPGRALHTAVRISVVDTGIGIRPEDFDKLFVPFRQIDSGLTRQHEGTGLGLAICRRLADLLGGEITAASEWGKGSEFIFLLPYREDGRP